MYPFLEEIVLTKFFLKNCLISKGLTPANPCLVVNDAAVSGLGLEAEGVVQVIQVASHQGGATLRLCTVPTGLIVPTHTGSQSSGGSHTQALYRSNRAHSSYTHR